MTQIILASQSPRRKELLTQMGVEFTTVPSNFDEYLDDDRDPGAVAIELAVGKAMTVAEQYPDAIVIGSDTIVTIEGQQLAKAADEDEARQMLKLCAGKRNDVTTSLAVIKLSDSIKLTGEDTSGVYFLPYDEERVSEYLATGDYKDKAGAWGIQSGAAPLIDYYSGNYDSIIGLPTKLLADFLAQLGVSARPFEPEAPVPKR
jgi:septum formation protein